MLLAASPAFANDTSYALFVTAKKAGDTPSAELLNTLFSQQLATTAGVQVVAFQGPAPSPPTELLESIEAGYRALNAAVSEPDKAKSERPGAEALGHFDKALQALQRLQTAKGALSRRAAARLYKGMAVAHGLNNQGPRAQPFIHNALNLWPEQTAREYAWSIGVSNLFSFVEKRRADSVEVGKISVTGLAGAAIRVDGKSAGVVPATIDRLRPGQHFVEVTRDGFGPMHALVTVNKDATTDVAAQLEPLADKARVEELTRLIGRQRKAAKATPLLAEVAQKVGAKRVIVLMVSPRKQSWTLSGFTGGEGETKQHKATITRDAQMVAGVQALIEEATGMKPGTAKGDPKKTRLDGPPATSLMRPAASGEKATGTKVGEGVEDTEFYETWWFWTAVGGGVAVITTAIVLAVVLSDEDEPPKTGTLDITLNPL